MTRSALLSQLARWPGRAASLRPSAAKGAKPLAGGLREAAPGRDAGDVAGKPDKQPQVLVTTSCQALHPVEPPSPQLRGRRRKALGEGVSALDGPIVTICHRRPDERPHPGI